MKTEDTLGLIGILVFLFLVFFLMFENSYHTSVERFYLVDKNWDIKMSEYYDTIEFYWEEECTGPSDNRKCQQVQKSKTVSHFITAIRTSGSYSDPVVYPVCPKSRSDSYCSTTEYFTTIWGRNKERMTLYVNLEWFNWLKREKVCSLNVYDGAFGRWIKSIKECN